MEERRGQQYRARLPRDGLKQTPNDKDDGSCVVMIVSREKGSQGRKEPMRAERNGKARSKGLKESWFGFNSTSYMIQL